MEKAKGKRRKENKSILQFALCIAFKSAIFPSAFYPILNPFGYIILIDISMPTQMLQENQSSLQGNAARRGFSSTEKWVIWAVFCLLVGLSTHWLVFPALLLMSWSVVRFRWYVGEKTVWWQRWPALVVFLAGLGLMLWVAR